jgi:hypothetical protein
VSGALAAGLALPALAAALAVRAAWPASLRLPAACWGGLALALGVALAAATYWIALVAAGGARAAVIGADAAALLIAAAAWWRRRGPRVDAPRNGTSGRDVALVALVAITGAAALAAFALNALDRPHGEWDAWAIWNARARFLFRAGGEWRIAFAPELMHADYPPLLPAAVAHAWTWAGADTTAAPIALALAVAAALVLLLGGALAALRDRSLALLGAACLLGTPGLLQRAAWQYADPLLACLLLATVALLAFADRAAAAGAAPAGLLALAGASAGAAACTKNEGLLLVLAVVAVRGALALRGGTWSARHAAAFAAGLAPPLSWLAYFKLALAPGSYLTADQDAGAYLARLADPARYATIAAAAYDELARSLGALVPALALAALLLGPRRPRPARRPAGWIGAAAALIATGYAAVYLVTPLDLAWQLAHSLDRLVLHLWPTVLFAALLYVASPAARSERVHPNR